MRQYSKYTKANLPLYTKVNYKLKTKEKAYRRK